MKTIKDATRLYGYASLDSNINEFPLDEFKFLVLKQDQYYSESGYPNDRPYPTNYNKVLGFLEESNLLDFIARTPTKNYVILTGHQVVKSKTTISLNGGQ